MKQAQSSPSLAELLPALKPLFDDSGSMVFLYDESDDLAYANDQFYELTCLDPGSTPTWSDMIRICHRTGRGLLIEADDIETWLSHARKRRGSVPYRQFEIDTVDGHWLLITETIIPGLGILGIGVDITRAKNTTTVLQHEYQQALVEAETDALTQMGNRRALDRLRRLLTLSGVNRVISALMIDIDWFKPYNDSLGHLQGDECLRIIADLIRSGFRSEEAYPLRIGGEEFLILMVDADERAATQLARRILRTIRSRAIPHPTSQVGHVTLSIGVATSTVTDDETISTLLNAADKALYESKGSGRDRVTVASNAD
ncbi:GGDEF domain-containing protein [Saccharospirillum impatiens]|uniref:GGDEF domain-containing protein n=1 Tax=Saccharospirillum impatiens TaxID=169438 RepID=UPI000402B217|nr:GGDEF domain-containing protein [Saccharospirillum impatiens]